MDITFEPITENTLQEVTDIYNYYVDNTTVTFHLEPVTAEEMGKTLSLPNPNYPAFCIMAEGLIVGFCYLGRFRPKQAYDITTEVTLYIKPNATQQGIGVVVLDFLEQEAKKLGRKNLIGVITAENENSLKLFDRCGYEQAAQLKNVGIKFDKVLDVIWYQKEI